MDYINKAVLHLIQKNHYFKSLYEAYISYIKRIIEINDIYFWYLSYECVIWVNSYRADVRLWNHYLPHLS
jgi:hypothetical protein